MWFFLSLFFLQRKLDLASSTGGLEPAVRQTRAALGRLEQFMRAAGSKGALTMELAARDFSYALTRIYTGGGKRNDGFQSRKGLGSRPGMAGIHICWVRGALEGNWVPPSSKRRQLSLASAADVTPPLLLPREPGIPMSPILPQELF